MSLEAFDYFPWMNYDNSILTRIFKPFSNLTFIICNSYDTSFGRQKLKFSQNIEKIIIEKKVQNKVKQKFIEKYLLSQPEIISQQKI